MDYAGGPAGLTGSNVGTCPLCGWTGPGRDAPFHECSPVVPEVVVDYYGHIAGEIADAGEAAEDYDDLDDDFEYCEHECDEECEDFQGFDICRHQHCMNCGGCGCPGYCDDYQTYNLRPDETGR